MIECQDFTIRDLLPDYVHGTLDDLSRVRVESHVSVCDDCEAELDLLRAMVASSTALTPAIDVSQIVAAIPQYGVRDIQSARSATRPVKHGLAKARHDAWYRSGSLRVAAAFLVVAAGITGVMVSGHSSMLPVLPNHQSVAHSGARVGVGLVNVSELSDENLETLIKSMDTIEASPPTEPDSSLTLGPVWGGGNA